MAINLGNFHWNGPHVYRVIESEMSRRLNIAGAELHQHVQDLLSRMGIDSGEDSQGRNLGRSRPGKPPKMDPGPRRDGRSPGTLRRSIINFRMPSKGVRRSLSHVVASTDPVSKWMELGTGRYRHIPDPTGTGKRPIHSPLSFNISPQVAHRFFYLEYGNPKSPPIIRGVKRRPFLVPALYDMIPRIKQILLAPIGGGRR